MFRYGYTFVWVLLVIALGVGAYFALSQLSYEIVYEGKNAQSAQPVLVYDESLELEKFKNTAEEEITEDPNESNEQGENSSSSTDDSTEEEKVETPKASSGEYKDLIEKLDRLVTEYGGTMKVGSKGTRVGTVQEFLNIYNKTSKTVDNQYGNGTLADVKKFQADHGLGADGLAGPGTFKKMSEWLQKQ